MQGRLPWCIGIWCPQASQIGWQRGDLDQPARIALWLPMFAGLGSLACVLRVQGARPVVQRMQLRSARVFVLGTGLEVVAAERSWNRGIDTAPASDARVAGLCPCAAGGVQERHFCAVAFRSAA